MSYLYIFVLSALLYLVYYLVQWVFNRKNVSDILILVSAVSFTLFIATRLYAVHLQLSETLNPHIYLAGDWTLITALATILTGMGLAIREAKPVINRAPAALSFIPFLLLLVHPLIQNTIVVKEMLFSFYSAGALTIALMLFSLSYFRKRIYGALLIATIILVAGLVSVNIPGNLFDYGTHIGMILYGLAVLFIASHYKKQLKEIDPNP